MFGLSTIWTSLIGIGLVLALVAGNYFYIKSLQRKADKLNTQNIELKDDNKELTQTIEEQRRMYEIISVVSGMGDKEREQSRQIRDNQRKIIDDKVKEGKDRPVGPLLREFLNE
jgi:ABC-type siderophore export system fused ATPase/permease subunit